MTGYSNEDVEIAARIFYQYLWGKSSKPWNTQAPEVRDYYRGQVRAVFDAVAPRIAERAWDEGATAAEDRWMAWLVHGDKKKIPSNPYAQDAT